MKPIVFLGLSLTEAEARGTLDADYRGPVMAGDLDAITSPAHVLIIDGILDVGRRLAIAEAERALERGLVLRGAASFGAVLASRLERKGMTGSGQVFDTLRGVKGSRSDLVRALYTSDRFRPLTVPLINPIVYCRQRGLPPRRFESLLHALRAIPLDARSWDRIRMVAASEGIQLPDDPRSMDFKRNDARSALQLFEAT